MSIYLYSPHKTENSIKLAQALDATQLRWFDGLRFVNKGKPINLDPADTVVCWGRQLPDLNYVKVINAHATASNNNLLHDAATKFITHKLGINSVPTYRTTKDKLIKLAMDIAKGLPSRGWPCTHLENMMYSRYAISGEHKAFVSKNGIIYSKCVGDFSDGIIKLNYPQQLLAELGLDFGFITFSVLSREVVAFRKIVTETNLTPEVLPLVVAELKKLIQDKGK